MDVTEDEKNEVLMEAEDVLQAPDLDHLISDLKSSKIEIVSVTERLGPFLTCTDIEKRIEGVKMFNRVLRSVPDEFLGDTELNFIAIFYADRCKDNHKVVPSVLDGILRIANMKHLGNDVSKTLLKAIFDNIPCQQQVQTDRFHIYTILHLFVTNRPQVIYDMGADFNLGFIFSMDGERDPRNLSFLFSILPPFIKTTKFGHVAEEMFEVMACYFPVDFNTQQQDANGITREDLAEKLAACLSASGEFADYCIPLIIEKMDSTLKVAKFDSLKLLMRCFSTFSCASLLPHLQFLWQTLFREMTQENDVELQNQAHECFGKLIGHFALQKNMADSCIAFLKEIIATVHPQLIEAKTRLKYELYLKILVTIARASEFSCGYIVENVNSFLVTQFSLTSDEGIKNAVINYFVLVYEACKHFNIQAERLEHFKFIFELIQTAIKSTQTDLRISGFKAISSLSELISADECSLLLEIMQHNIDHELSQSIANVSKMSILSLARQHPTVFKSHIDRLFETVFLISDIFLLRRRTDELCSLISINDYRGITIHHIMRSILTSENDVSMEILKIFVEVTQNKCLFSDDMIRSLQLDYGLIGFLLELLNGKFVGNDLKDSIFITTFIKVIMRCLSGEEQLKLYSELIPEYRLRLERDSNIALLILEALLNSSRGDIFINDVDAVLNHTVKYALNINCDLTNEKACKLITNILNKYMGHKIINEFYEQLKNKLDDILSVEENFLKAIKFISWLTKSLLLSMHPDSSLWFIKLIDMLNDDKWGTHVAHQFKLIMMDSEDVLNVECFSKVNLLYRQKVFHIFIQRSFETDQKNQKESHYLAMAYIIQFIPRSVLLMELSKITPILLDCLKFKDSDLLVAILNTIVFLIQNNKLSVGSQSILSRCLQLSEKDNSIKVRIASLQCLYNIAHYCPTVQLLHHKQDIIMELAKRLDDPKRLVRNEAVKARTRWFLIGSPGENKDK